MNSFIDYNKNEPLFLYIKAKTWYSDLNVYLITKTAL